MAFCIWLLVPDIQVINGRRYRRYYFEQGEKL